MQQVIAIIHSLFRDFYVLFTQYFAFQHLKKELLTKNRRNRDNIKLQYLHVSESSQRLINFSLYIPCNYNLILDLD